MTRERRAGAAVLCALLLPACAHSTDGDGQTSAQDAADHFLRVFDDLEWESFRAAWVAEPTAFVPTTPERLDDREIEEAFKAFFERARAASSGPPYLHLEPHDLQVKLYDRTAIVTFTLGDLPESGPPARLAQRTLVFVREGGTWKLAHLHASVTERR